MVKKILIASIFISFVLPFVCGCSQGSKKESYDKEGPWHSFQSEGPYKKTHIKILKACPEDKTGIEELSKARPEKEDFTMPNEGTPNPHPDPYPVNKPQTVKKKRVVVITMQGDKYVGTVEEKSE